VYETPADRGDAWKNTPEKGASLRVLRWKRFVRRRRRLPGDVKKFTEKSTSPARRQRRLEDVRPNCGPAANVGSGPDIILSTHDDPALYPESWSTSATVANYLGKKYGGWYPVAEAYCKRGNN